jgi:hypothetical protein
LEFFIKELRSLLPVDEVVYLEEKEAQELGEKFTAVISLVGV